MGEGTWNENKYCGNTQTKKLSQDELAREVGVTRQTITSLETGKYTASLLLAYRIAKYFNLTIEEVFIFEEEVE